MSPSRDISVTTTAAAPASASSATTAATSRPDPSSHPLTRTSPLKWSTPAPTRPGHRSAKPARNPGCVIAGRTHHDPGHAGVEQLLPRRLQCAPLRPPARGSQRRRRCRPRRPDWSATPVRAASRSTTWSQGAPAASNRPRPLDGVGPVNGFPPEVALSQAHAAPPPDVYSRVKVHVSDAGAARRPPGTAAEISCPRTSCPEVSCPQTASAASLARLHKVGQGPEAHRRGFFGMELGGPDGPASMAATTGPP